MAAVVLLSSIVLLGASVLVHLTELGADLTAGRSSLVLVAQNHPALIFGSAGGLVVIAGALVRWPRAWIGYAAWAGVFLLWCLSVRAITVYPDLGKVRALWLFVETGVIFDAERQDHRRPDGSAMQDIEEVTNRTTVTSSNGWLMLSYEGRTSSVFVGPLLETNALDLLAYSSFAVTGYQAPGCRAKGGSGACVGRAISSGAQSLK